MVGWLRELCDDNGVSWKGRVKSEDKRENRAGRHTTKRKSSLQQFTTKVKRVGNDGLSRSSRNLAFSSREGELSRHRYERPKATAGEVGYRGANKLYIIHESVRMNVNVCQHRYFII